MTDHSVTGTASEGATLRPETAQRMLALVDAITDHDPGAASHSLLGLLRLVAGTRPTSAEATSLRITGLAELTDGQLVLTPEGREVLAQDSISRPAPSAQPMPRAQALKELAEHPASDPEAFARLRIGETVYIIGEEGRTLAFRTDAASPWQRLERGLEDGWSEIAAEIVQRTRNALEEYVRMHMIRSRESSVPGEENHFDLYGLAWEVKDTGTTLHVRVEGSDWTEVRASALAHVAGLRERAAAALVTHVKDLRQRIGEDVAGWAKRIAAGASVIPL